ncbi:facilitated trehalose transporter Tret1-like [Colias croceus]|uniref:facilitated trehalose transporter Tret1-like n=1 Tax=Colias crocea TaxID=72248 RepID=UPI001E27B8E7|nr:facilitated trehalose transporter Tret1-like [Colias croceus]
MLGVSFTWPSSTMGLFTSPNTPLNRMMTEFEVSLLGSLSCISAVLTLPFTGILMEKFGRKYTCFVLYAMQMISWTIVISINYVEAILLSIFISGITSCTLLFIPLYVSEFCQESIRGSMASSVLMFFAFGMLTSYLMGGLLAYNVMNYISLGLAVAGSLLIFLVKDSALYLMTQGREREAALSVAHYKSLNVNSKEVENEIEHIKKLLNPELDDAITPEEETLKPEFKRKEKLSIWRFLKKSRSSRRALVVCLVLYTATVFQGLVVVQVYAAPLFSKAVPSMSATVSSVVFAIVTIVAGMIAAYLVEVLGRKPLMVHSSIASAVCCILLATQIQFEWGPNWITAVFIYLFCIFYTIGAGTIPYIYSAEVFLPEIKSFASLFAMEWAFIGFFIVLFIFNPLVNYIGLGGVFYIFAAVCLLTAIFCGFFMPETKGLTVDVIQLQFAKTRFQNKA